MWGVFCTIRQAKKFSVAVKESLSAVKGVGRVASHSGESAMSTGAVLSLADDALLAAGRQGARLAGSGGRTVTIEAAALARGAVVFNGLTMAIDAIMIGYWSYHIHNGSESERAMDIERKMQLLTREKNALREVYQRCEKFL